MIKTTDIEQMENTIRKLTNEVTYLNQVIENSDKIVEELIKEVEFLLPHATNAILELQLCHENPTLLDARDTFHAIKRLIRSDLTTVVEQVVKDRRIDLLMLLMKNECHTQ